MLVVGLLEDFNESFFIKNLGSSSQVLNSYNVGSADFMLCPNQLGDEVVHRMVHINNLIREIWLKPDVVKALARCISLCICNFEVHNFKVQRC